MIDGVGCCNLSLSSSEAGLWQRSCLSRSVERKDTDFLWFETGNRNVPLQKQAMLGFFRSTITQR